MAKEPTYENLLEQFKTWATSQPDIRSVLLVGSRARTNHPADDWSDLDLILFSTQPAKYAQDGRWLDQVGEVWARALGATGYGDPEWVALYAGGLKVDCVLATLPGSSGYLASLQEMIAASPYRYVYSRGVTVLLDRDHPFQETHLPNLAVRPPTRPSPEEFIQAVNRFYIQCVRQAGYLRRGDLWRAAQPGAYTLREGLLKMMEWQARTVFGPEHDTWYEGRHLEDWIDPQAVAVLPHLFGGFDAEGQWQALQSLLGLYRRLAQETARQLGYAFPSQMDRHVRDLLQRWFVTRPDRQGPDSGGRG